jgi:hypothetical protein
MHFPFADTSDAYNQGYEQGVVIGRYLGIAIVVGIVVFAGFAVIQAVRKRTRGWIIIASIVGFLVTLPVLVGVGLGVIRGVRRALNNPGAFTYNAVPGVPASSAPELLTGKALAYHIALPAGWTVKDQHPNFDTLAMSRNLYLGVSAEEVDIGTSAVAAKIALKKVRSVGTDVQASEPKVVFVDGQIWMEFTCKAHVNEIPFGYLFLVHSGPEGTYQLVGWTFQNVFDRDVDQLRSVMTTFKFPANRVAATPSRGVVPSAPDPDTSTAL